MTNSVLSAVIPNKPLILVLTEKPFMTDVFVAGLDRLPDVHPWLAAHEIVFVSLMGLGCWRFAFPQNLRAIDLPLVAHPRYRFGTYSDGHPLWAALYRRHQWQRGEMTRSVNTRSHFAPVDEATLASLLDRAAAVIRFTDSDRRGSRVFHLALTGGSWAIDAPALSCSPIYDAGLLDDCMDANIDATVARLVAGALPTWPQRPEVLAAALAKEFFDYGWAINNRALMAAFLKAAGVKRLDLIDRFQKSCLSLLLFLARSPEGRDRVWSLSDLIHHMDRYWDQPGSRLLGTPIELGSASSRGEIIENLIAIGLASSASNHRVQLTDIGTKLASLLPKDAWDPHQMRRLEEWALTWPDSQPAMERYLGTYWAKIRNHGRAFEGGALEHRGARRSP